MPAIRSTRLVRPGVLSNLKPSSIHGLLSPFSAYFAGRGAPLAGITEPSPALDEVMAVLASPTESTPPELVERLELLDLIADPTSGISFEDAYDGLVAYWLEPDDSAEDLAVKILLHAPDVVWREFDRRVLQIRRSLVSFSQNPSLKFLTPDDQRIAQLENLMSPWFLKNARSGNCRVHFRQERGGAAFVIRHGDLLKRIGVYDEDGRSSSKILRPERVDVAHFRYATGEWQISGIGGRLQELYRQAFGTVFYGSPNALAHSKRYSLKPLREGPSVLVCDPNSQIPFAELVALKIELPGGQQVLFSRGNIFNALSALNASILQGAVFLEARIDLKIAGKRRLVPVVLNPLRDKISGPHLHDAIEPWLAEREFSNITHETFLLESA